MYKGRILFVDDEPLILQSIKCLLRRESYTQDYILNPREALAYIDQFPPEVIISDFRMPDLNGLEFFAEVKKKMPQTTRIVLTGYADMELLQPAVTAGTIHRFLFKPVSPTAFRHILNRELDVQLQSKMTEGGVSRVSLDQHALG